MKKENVLNGEMLGTELPGTPADRRHERPDGPTRRAGDGRFCLVFGGETLLYHQTALRLSLEGYAVTGVGPAAVNAGLSREIERAGGTFWGSSVSEVGGEDGTLTVLASAQPFQPLNWGAEHRVHISSGSSPASPVTRKTATITYPRLRLGRVLPDLIEQVVELLRRPPCAVSMRYVAGADGRLTRFSSGQADRTAVPAGVEVRLLAGASGVFATRAYRCGERVMTTGGVLRPIPTGHSVRVGTGRHLEPYAPARLLSRIPSPNLEMHFIREDRIDFHALRDLQVGEELTCDRRGSHRAAGSGKGEAKDAPVPNGFWTPGPEAKGLLRTPPVSVFRCGSSVPEPE